MAGLHNGSLPSWSVFCFMHARVGVCYEVDTASSKAPGVRVSQIITFPAPTYFYPAFKLLQSQVLINLDREIVEYI